MVYQKLIVLLASAKGWMILNGPKQHAKGYIEGLDMLASMRLCANVPMQHAIQTALGGYQSINEFVQPGGRLLEQRNKAYELLTQIPGISCVKPMGAMYMFPKLDIQNSTFIVMKNLCSIYYVKRKYFSYMVKALTGTHRITSV